MRLLIKKKSGRTFPPPFEGLGKTAIAINTTINQFDPKKREAYELENGTYVNCDLCDIIKNLENN